MLTRLKSKAASILCIVLLTLLASACVVNHSKESELVALRKSVVQYEDVNKRLNEQLQIMQTELDTKPREYITLVKDVVIEVCEGQAKQAAIKNLPSKKKEVDDVQVESNVADIDDMLPDDLLWLLQ